LLANVSICARLHAYTKVTAQAVSGLIDGLDERGDGMRIGYGCVSGGSGGASFAFDSFPSIFFNKSVEFISPIA
jgi:hypothetical protein